MINEILKKEVKKYIHEVRKPDIDYNEKFLEDQLDKVVAVLQGKKGSYATKLAREYDGINEEYKRVKKERKQLREEVLEYAEGLFDAEDEVATRIVETVGLTLQLDKPVSYEREKFDKEGFFEELLEIVPEIEEQLDQLKDKYTTVKKIQRSSVVRVKEESLTDKTQSALSKIKSKLVSFWKKVRNWGESYDRRLEKLRSKYLSM